MKITRLQLSNWKCFADELSLDFNTIEIFSFPNGSGKTAVLEAVMYGLYGKCDKPQETYQNHEGQTCVNLHFEVDGLTYQLEREFPKKKATLYQEGKPFIEGINEIFAYIDSIAPYNLIKRLWFKGDIAENEVLTFKFFKDEILSEQLKEPTAIYKYLTSEIRHLTQEQKAITIDETLRDKKTVEDEIKEIEDTLKERISVPDARYQQALQAQQACQEASQLEKPSFDIQTIRQWESIDIASLEQALQKEIEKYVDEDLALLSEQTLRAVLNANIKQHKCVVCSGEFSEKRSSYIQDVLKKGFKSEDAIENIKEQIAFKKQHTQAEIDQAKHWYELKSIFESCADFKTIIQNYQKKNDDLWKIKEDLQRELTLIVHNEEAIKRHGALEKQIKDDKTQKAFVQQYIDETTSTYTAILFSKANACLSSINPKYSNLCLVESELALNKENTQLFVSQLSRGEKTMCALALITTIRDMFTPDAPLIFDESFSALSSENTQGVIAYLADSFSQIFVVTHSSDWVCYDEYNEATTTIRTSW